MNSGRLGRPTDAHRMSVWRLGTRASFPANWDTSFQNLRLEFPKTASASPLLGQRSQAPLLGEQ